MGQTLTNGIFLPNEGERNCYTGLASNWTILDGVIGGYSAHAANLTIHVTAADKEAWNGKADDAGVMHLTGDESSTGKKTFGDMATFDGSYLGNEASTNARTDLVLESNRDTHGKSGMYMSKFRQNRAQGSMGSGDSVWISFDVLENEVRTNGIMNVLCSGWVDDVPTKVKIVSGVTDSSFGSAANPSKINELNPGALSLPNISAGVDISGYLTNAGTTTPSEYTPTVDGWLVIAISADSPAFIRVFSSGGIDAIAYAERNEIGSTTGGTYTRYAALTVPCRQNDKQNIILMPSTTGIVKAMFYPCMGNV